MDDNNFFNQIKGQFMKSAVESTLENKWEDLREQQGDSPVAKVMGLVKMDQCLEAADQMGVGVKDLSGAAEKAGLDAPTCFKLFAQAQKDDKGDMLDTVKDLVSGQQKESEGCNFGGWLKKDEDKDKDAGGAGANVGKFFQSLF